MVDSFRKLNPLSLLRNPVIFVTEVGAAITTLGLFLRSGDEPFGFVFQVALWLWFTVFFANFAEAMAEGRGKAQAVFTAPWEMTITPLDTCGLVRLKGGRSFRGKLHGFDQHMNLVLEDADDITNPDNARKIGTIIVRGDNVVLVSPPPSR